MPPPSSHLQTKVMMPLLQKGNVNSISVTESSIDPKMQWTAAVPDQHFSKIENLENEIAKKMEEVR